MARTAASTCPTSILPELDIPSPDDARNAFDRFLDRLRDLLRID